MQLRLGGCPPPAAISYHGLNVGEHEKTTFLKVWGRIETPDHEVLSSGEAYLANERGCVRDNLEDGNGKIPTCSNQGTASPLALVEASLRTNLLDAEAF